MLSKVSPRFNVRFALFSLTFLALLLGMAACECPKQDSEAPKSAMNDTPAQAQKAPAEKKEAPSEVGEVAQETSLVGLYIQFVMQRLKDPTQVDTLSTMYQGTLQDFVKGVDAEHGAKLNQAVLDALAAIKADKDVKVNAQRAEKSIQRALLWTWLDGLAALQTNPSDVRVKAELENVQKMLPVLAERRGKSTKKGRIYVEQFKASYTLLTTSKDAEAIRKAAQDLQQLTYKLVLYSVQYELIGLRDARGVDPVKAGEKQVEAFLYYESLFDEHARRQADSAKTLRAELAKTPESMDYELMKTLLSKDFAAECAEIPLDQLGW